VKITVFGATESRSGDRQTRLGAGQCITAVVRDAAAAVTDPRCGVTVPALDDPAPLSAIQEAKPSIGVGRTEKDGPVAAPARARSWPRWTSARRAVS